MREIQLYRESHKGFIDESLVKPSDVERAWEGFEGIEDNIGVFVALPEVAQVAPGQVLDKNSPDFGKPNFMFGRDAFGDPNRPFG